MPIYAYKCENCGHAQDVLQKMSDPLLTVCPACGQSAYKKQLTAAGFQLKGSGWYVTDFREGKKPDAASNANPATAVPASADAAASSPTPTLATPATPASAAPSSASSSSASSSSATSPSPAPAGKTGGAA